MTSTETIFKELFAGVMEMSDPAVWTMFAIGGILIWLGVKKDYEPVLLFPMGVGCILANIPGHFAVIPVGGGEPGFLQVLYEAGIANELFPVLIFVAQKFAAELLAPLTVTAFCYMSLVPIIQPPIIRLLTTKQERRIRMAYKEEKPVSWTARFLFPFMVVLFAGILAPISVPLIGALMFGNMLKVSGVVDSLASTAQNELANLVTLFLGITVGATMTAENILTFDVLKILILGAAAFVFDTVGGVLFAKLANLFLKQKLNPMIGACGISAFPMSGRVVAKMALKEDPSNFIIQHAMGVNVAGQVASVVAGGLVLALIPVLS